MSNDAKKYAINTFSLENYVNGIVEMHNALTRTKLVAIEAESISKQLKLWGLSDAIPEIEAISNNLSIIK
jgi:hypothetical protein